MARPRGIHVSSLGWTLLQYHCYTILFALLLFIYGEWWLIVCNICSCLAKISCDLYDTLFSLFSRVLPSLLLLNPMGTWNPPETWRVPKTRRVWARVPVFTRGYEYGYEIISVTYVLTDGYLLYPPQTRPVAIPTNKAWVPKLAWSSYRWLEMHWKLDNQ
jgi:hypothetical protein